MPHETRQIRFLWVFITSCVVGIVGCGDRAPATPVASGGAAPGSTVDQVCTIAAEQMGVERSKVAPGTSLADLAADELDFVELVMELEEHFDISIPDDAAEGMLGTDNWQQGMKNVTMARLAAVVDERNGSSHGRESESPRK